MKQLPTQAASKAHAPCSTIFKQHYRTPCRDAKREEMLAAGKGAYMCTKCGGTRLWGHHTPSKALDPKGRSMPNMYQSVLVLPRVARPGRADAWRPHCT